MISAARSFLALALLLAATTAFAETDSAPTPAKRPAPSASAGATPSSSTENDPPAVDPKALYDLGKQLFDDYAPDEIKKDYEFPSHEQWDEFSARLQQALQGGSLEELAAFEPEVRRALAAFRVLPEYSDYVDWLEQRLDLIETARTAVAAQQTQPPPHVPGPIPPSTTPPSTETPTPPSPAGAGLPYYDVWLQRLRTRPRPARADELVPLLKLIFSAEGLPAELAWLAEVESSLNPAARSPAGARGLFQLMPATAKSMGLSLLPFDERVQPGKNARAAARLLRKLHDRFDSWPLALAAYNAGEGRIAAALKKKDAGTSFADIAETLPAETRMYVPKVFATLTVRENVSPESLPPPTTPSVTKKAGVHAPPPPAIATN